MERMSALTLPQTLLQALLPSDPVEGVQGAAVWGQGVVLLVWFVEELVLKTLVTGAAPWEGEP